MRKPNLTLISTDGGPAKAHIVYETIGRQKLRVAIWKGTGEGRPILFFNGIGANIEAVAPLAEALTERRFIMFDMPGVGGSPEPLVPYNTFTMSWIAKELLKRFDAGVVDVMGVSWGGAMAQHFTLQHGSHVRRLILAATTAGMLMLPGNPAALSKMADPRRYIDAAFMEKHFMTLYGGLTGGKSEHISRLTPAHPARLCLSVAGDARLDQRPRLAVPEKAGADHDG